MLAATGGFLLVIVLVLALILAFEVWMFVDAVKNPRLSDLERLGWCIAMVLVHPFVAIAYYFIVYTKRESL